MRPILASFLYFFICLVLLTIGIGGLGFIAPQLASVMVSIPYLIGFYLMGLRFARRYQVAPTTKQRWQLSLGCCAIFWLYSILAGFIGLWLATGHQQINFSALSDALHNHFFTLLLLGLFTLISLLFIGLGYLFLGKPLNKMVAFYQNK